MDDAEFRFSSTVWARLPGRIKGRFGQAVRCAGHKDFHRLRDHHIQHIRRQAVFLREQGQRLRVMRESGLAQAADASGLERTAHRLHLFPRAGEALGNGFEHSRRNGSGFFRTYRQFFKTEHRKAVQRLGFPRQRVGIKQLAARQRQRRERPDHGGVLGVGCGQFDQQTAQGGIIVHRKSFRLEQVIFERMCGGKEKPLPEYGNTRELLPSPTPPPFLSPCLHTWLSGIHAETSHQCKTIKKSVQFIHPATGTDFKCNIKIRGGPGGIIPPGGA